MRVVGISEVGLRTVDFPVLFSCFYGTSWYFLLVATRVNMNVPLLLLFFACGCSNLLALKIHHSSIIKRSLQLRPTRTTTTCIFATSDNNEKKEQYDASYYKGLITDPVSSKESDAKDNLTPNIKFIGITGLLIAGLFGAFIVANLNTPPPPF